MGSRYLLVFCCLTGLASAQTNGDNLSLAKVVSRVTATENAFVEKLSQYRPLVETYIQFMHPVTEDRQEIDDDAYFIGNAEFNRGVDFKNFNPDKTFSLGALTFLKKNTKPRLIPRGFAQMAIIDYEFFTPEHYDFENPRGEFLGEVRCIAFDVKPKPKEPRGRFVGRIWVEDRTFHVVRFSGTYTFSRPGRYFHFNSYREQAGPGLWLPSITYIEETSGAASGKLSAGDLKGLVHFWSFAKTGLHQPDTFTKIMIDAPQAPQNADANEPSRTEALRQWEHEAEENTLQRMEKAGLIGPPGDVEKVLDTVLNNLVVTNKISIEPPLRTRVLLTTPLESFTIGHTLLVSRGFIDVLPSEASLAAVIARELASIALGFKSTTMNAFSDRMLFDDQQILRQLAFRRSPTEDLEANHKAMEILRNSPYAGQLPQVGLFLKGLSAKAGVLPNLVLPRMGNPVADQGRVILLPELIPQAPALDPASTEQIVALPLVSRIHLDAWSDRTELIRSKPVALLSPSEKMPFEIMPVVLALKWQDSPEQAAEGK